MRFNYAAYPGPGGLPILISLFGNPNLENERLTATEAGFRKQWSTALSFEATAFFNQYRDLTSEETGSTVLEADPPPEHLLVPTYLGNLMHGETHGMEAFANVRLASRWTLSPGYTFLAVHLHRERGRHGPDTGPETEGGSPRQQAELRSQVNLPRHWEWTTSAYFVGRLIAAQNPVLHPPGYQFGVATLRQNITGPGGAELAQKPSPGVRRAGLDRAAEPGSAQRLCQAHVAVLNVHEVILSKPTV